jgi:hypothetical protein
MSRASDKARRVRRRSFRFTLERFARRVGLVVLPEETTQALMQRALWEVQPPEVKQMVAEANARMDQMLRDMNPLTATGPALEELAALFGVAPEDDATMRERLLQTLAEPAGVVFDGLCDCFACECRVAGKPLPSVLDSEGHSLACEACRSNLLPDKPAVVREVEDGEVFLLCEEHRTKPGC